MPGFIIAICTNFRANTVAQCRFAVLKVGLAIDSNWLMESVQNGDNSIL